MKTLKQIREEIEVNEAEDKKLTSLIRAGLFDVRKLPLLKRALSKDNTKMSPTERNSLLDLLDTLIAHVTGDAAVFTKVRHNVMHEDINETYEVAGELPMILILKRRSIRAFPDGQRVALYWADKLKTFISVPYSSVGVGYSQGASVSEEVTLVAEDDVQELDKKTLVSYANKAHTDRDWQKRDSALYLKAALSADSKDRPDLASQRISHAITADKNVKKRTTGIELANKKIAKIESKPKKLGEDDVEENAITRRHREAAEKTGRFAKKPSDFAGFAKQPKDIKIRPDAVYRSSSSGKDALPKQVRDAMEKKKEVKEDDVEEAKKETSFWDDADRGKESLRKADAKAADKQKKSNAKLFNKVANRKNVKETLEDIVNENAQKILNFEDGGSTTIGPFTASAILEVYNAINDDNKAKMKASLNESRTAFNKMAEFALSKV